MTAVLLIGADDWLAGRLSRLGPTVQGDEVTPGAQDPDVVVVDLAVDGAIGRVRSVRKRWPAALVAGYLTVPDAELWLDAQRAGCDLVANRGALVNRLRPMVADASSGRKRFPLLDEADLAGRLGFIAHVDDTPVGPVAVYRVDGELYACADVCPHQGATLSQGELQAGIVTCPRHGSQFDVRSGHRTRGPADHDIARYRLDLEAGQLFLVLDQSDRQEQGS